MEEAIIDLKRIKSIFVEDDAYERINAPQWVDFTSADDPVDGGDDAWFCRAGCDHPKTLQDWLKSNETAKVSNYNKTARKPPLLGLSNKYYEVVEDAGNQDSDHIAKVGEEGIKSRTEMQETNATDNGGPPEQMTGCLCAGNLVSCADYLLFTVAEFCHELRKVLKKKKNNF